MMGSSPSSDDVEMKSCDEDGDKCSDGNGIHFDSHTVTVESKDVASEFLRHKSAIINEEINLEELKEALNTPRSQIIDQLARADICPENRRPKLVLDKSAIKQHYGFDIGSQTYLWPEEALYLLETGKLEVYCDKIALSVQRARSLFLHSRSQPENLTCKLVTCDLDEYAVYKYLSKHGYRLRRRETKFGKTPKPNNTSINLTVNAGEDADVSGNESLEDNPIFENEDVMCLDPTETLTIEEDTIRIKFPTTKTKTKTRRETSFHNLGNPVDDDSIEGVGKVYNPLFGATAGHLRRGMKRKASLGLLSDDDSSTSSHQSFRQDADKYYAEVITKIDENAEDNAQDGDFEMRSTIRTEDDEMTTESEPEPVPGPSSAARGDSTVCTPYTVTEADSDSDIEIVDEVIHSRTGVSIEEVSFSDNEENPGFSGDYSQPGTSASSKVIVDLVSSDSDEFSAEEKMHPDILSTFIPNAKIRIPHPPSYLLPHNIPAREGQIYEFDMKHKLTKSPDLENIAEELNLETSVNSPKTKLEERVNCNSWKEWRHAVMSEARDVLNESLLAPSNSDISDFEKLHLWDDNEGSKDKRIKCNPIRIPFDIYSLEGNKRYGKGMLGNEILPLFHVAIVGSTDEVLKFPKVGSVIQDGIPLLFAIVSDERDILFVTSNLSPLPTLVESG